MPPESAEPLDPPRLSRAEIERMRSAERAHWWYVGLRTMIGEALCDFSAGVRPRVLDAGCGTGGNLRLLRARWPDAHLTALDFCAEALAALEPGLGDEVRCADLNDRPVFAARFDLVLCCDVLSHAGLRRETVLRHFLDLLRPGGRLLLNVPAFPWLRGRHDASVCVAHRFRRGELAAACLEAGFRDVDVRPWNTALLPLVAARRILSRGRPGRELRSDLDDGSTFWNGALCRYLRWESRLASRWRLPWGTSIFARATAPPA